MNNPLKSKRLLKRLYSDQKMTIIEIGDLFSLHFTTVAYWMRKHKIKTRPAHRRKKRVTHRAKLRTVRRTKLVSVRRNQINQFKIFA